MSTVFDAIIGSRKENYLIEFQNSRCLFFFSSVLDGVVCYSSIAMGKWRGIPADLKTSRLHAGAANVSWRCTGN